MKNRKTKNKTTRKPKKFDWLSAKFTSTPFATPGKENDFHYFSSLSSAKKKSKIVFALNRKTGKWSEL